MLGKTIAIARREFLAFFFSPIAYVVITVFLLMAGYLFALSVTRTEIASLRAPFLNMAFALLFIVPLLTMRLLAEETHSGTIEVLLTDPVRDGEIVVGKFLAACAFYTVMLAPTTLFVVILAQLGQPDYGPILSGYLGLLLFGYMLISIGLFNSALTKNQIVAAVLTVVFFLILWLLRYAADLVDSTLARLVLFFSLYTHYDSFRRGIVDSRDTIFFITTTLLFLFLATRVIEARRWR